MRSLAFGARHEPVPPIPAPPPPAVIGVTAQGAVAFRGSLGAREYTIERQSAPDGPWDIVAEHFDETRVAYRPFVDPDPPVGQKVRYRVVAANETGRSQPSAPSDEVAIDGRLFVDEMDQALGDRRDRQQRRGHHRPRRTLQAGSRASPRRRRRARSTGSTGVPVLRIFAFTGRPGQVLELGWSTDGHDLAKLAGRGVVHRSRSDPLVNLGPCGSRTAIPPAARFLRHLARAGRSGPRRDRLAPDDAMKESIPGDLERGRDAYQRHDWPAAHASLTASEEAAPLDVEDFDRLAWAAELSGDTEGFLKAMERVYEVRLAEGALGRRRGRRSGSAFAPCRWARPAARAPGSVGRSGWSRAKRANAPSRDTCCCRPPFATRWRAARRRHDVAARAAAIGDRVGDADLSAFGRTIQGRALLRWGRSIAAWPCSTRACWP